LISSSVFTPSPHIPEQAWGLPFANALSSAPEGESGSKPNWASDQHFSLRSRAETDGGPAFPGRSISIMLVEDNPADARLVRAALEHYGVEGEMVLLTDGEKAILFIEAVDTDQAACPGLAIIDLSLPKKSGHEVLQSVRSSPKWVNVPVVILSSSDAAADKTEAARLGASRYLRKPSRLDDFLKLGMIFRELLCDPQQRGCSSNAR
jgi:CheY-like chemotaxis protein